MADTFVILDAQGREHEFPAGMDPTVAARIVREQTTVQRLGSAKTGGVASDDPNLKPDMASFVSGVASNFNPMTYLRTARALLTTDPRETIPALASGLVQPVRDLMNAGGGPDTQGSQTAGQLVGAGLVGPAMRTSQTALRGVAPKLMGVTIPLTPEQRLAYPNAAHRLVDERIIPKGTRVQEALTATEQDLRRRGMQYELAQAETNPGRLLPPSRQTIPLGDAPLPQGGRPATPLAHVSELREQNQTRSLQGLHPDNPHDPIFGGDVRSAAPGAVADTVQGPGVLFQPMPAHGPGSPRIRGAAASMVDPVDLANAAYRDAFTEGKMGGLGNVPNTSPLDAAYAEYLAQNTRPRSWLETLAQKRTYGARASHKAGSNAPPVTNESMAFNRGLEKANRASLIDRLPAAEGLLAKEQDLLGALTGQEQRVGLHLPTTKTGMTLRALRSPTLIGGTAIRADQLAGLLQDMEPSMVRAAMGQIMASHLPAEPEE